MPFIGKNPTAGFATIVKDTLTADGSTTQFTLSKQVASATDIAVFVGNVRQEPTTAYTVNGTTLDFGSGNAPATGLDMYVLHIGGTQETSIVPADGTISSAKIVSSAVTSNKIASNAVTMNKLATSGTLPALNGSALTGMGMTLIGLYSPSSSVATMDITLSATAHDFYKIVGFLDNGHDAANAHFRFLNSAGNSVGGGSDYHYSRIKAENAAVAPTTDNAHGYVDWSPTIGNSTNESGIGFEMIVGPCNSTVFPVQMHGQSFQHDEGSHASLNLFGGGFVSKKGGDGDFGGVRFFFSSGDVGQNSFVYVYGMNKT